MEMSKPYLQYLIKRRSVVLVFFFVCFLGMAMFLSVTRDEPLWRYNSGAVFALYASVILSYVLPVIQFSYVHNRRSADRYFSLPLSRRKQLFTEILFIFAICAVYYLVIMCMQYAVFGTRVVPFARFGKTIVLTVIALLMLVLINTSLYLLGNNLVDGLILMAAYTAIPVLAAITSSAFEATMVAGGSVSFNIGLLLSPVGLLVNNIDAVMGGEAVHMGEIVLALVYCAIAVYGLHKNFIERRAERAEQLSAGILAYPTVITVYAACILFILGCSAISEKPSYILYLILFVIYVIAHFVYKRRIELKPAGILLFAGLLVLTHACAYIGWNTHGFHQADNYTLYADNYMRYYYNVQVSDADLGKADPRGHAYVDLEIVLPKADKEAYAEVQDILENCRRQSIARFYEKQPYENYYGSMNIGDASARNRYSSENYRYYRIMDPISEDDLQKINKQFPVTIYDDRDGSTCALKEYLEKRKK